MELDIKVEGMTCEGCTSRVEKTLKVLLDSFKLHAINGWSLSNTLSLELTRIRGLLGILNSNFWLRQASHPSASIRSISWSGLSPSETDSHRKRFTYAYFVYCLMRELKCLVFCSGHGRCQECGSLSRDWDCDCGGWGSWPYGCSLQCASKNGGGCPGLGIQGGSPFWRLLAGTLAGILDSAWSFGLDSGPSIAGVDVFYGLNHLGFGSPLFSTPLCVVLWTLGIKGLHQSCWSPSERMQLSR